MWCEKLLNNGLAALRIRECVFVSVCRSSDLVEIVYVNRYKGSYMMVMKVGPKL